jgi:hypothetical protein
MPDKQTAVRVGDRLIDASSNPDDKSSREADLVVQKITYDGFAEVHHRSGSFAAYIPLHLIDGDGPGLGALPRQAGRRRCPVTNKWLPLRPPSASWTLMAAGIMRP